MPSLSDVATLLINKPQSPFLGLPYDELFPALEKYGTIYDPVPSRSGLIDVAARLIPPGCQDIARGYEGLHLAQEKTAFSGVYVALKGTLVRYSLLTKPDFFWLEPRNPNYETQLRTQQACIKPPWETAADLVSLGFLLSHTRVFDITREFETVGTTEILTGAETWKTCVFQCRNSQTFFLDARFMNMLSEKSSALFYKNAARISITTWAQRCRREQEILTRAAKAMLAKELAIEHLDEIAEIICSLNPRPGCYNAETNTITLNGNMNRLAYYIGLRPSSLDAAWKALRGTPNQGQAEGVLAIRGDNSYIVNLARLSEVRGKSKFAMPLDLDVTD